MKIKHKLQACWKILIGKPIIANCRLSKLHFISDCGEVSVYDTLIDGSEKTSHDYLVYMRGGSTISLLGESKIQVVQEEGFRHEYTGSLDLPRFNCYSEEIL